MLRITFYSVNHIEKQTLGFYADRMDSMVDEFICIEYNPTVYGVVYEEVDFDLYTAIMDALEVAHDFGYGKVCRDRIMSAKNDADIERALRFARIAA